MCELLDPILPLTNIAKMFLYVHAQTHAEKRSKIKQKNNETNTIDDESLSLFNSEKIETWKRFSFGNSVIN